ncbi:MAG: putative lipoprotein [Crocinitomicaceae bacterium]|jgi:PKD repeat protein|nr:putative lipoprotein [Crocinitomicaceae bacterium]
METGNTQKAKSPALNGPCMDSFSNVKQNVFKPTTSMKTRILTQGLKLTILALLLPLCKVSAQNISLTETRPAGMTVCMGDYPFTLKIRNNSAQTASNFRVKLDLPDYIYYTGNLANAGEFNVSNLNEPVFTLPNIAGYDSLVISYTAEASCGIIASLSNDLTVQNKYTCTYTMGGNNNTLGPVPAQSYNLLFANLSMVVTNPINTVLQYGDRINENSAEFRSVQLLNSGNGSLDTVVIRIRPEGEIVYNRFVSEAHPAIAFPYTTEGSDLLITLSGQALQNAILQGDADNLFDPGESISLIEDFTVVSCTGLNTLYKVEWGCYQEACNTNSGNATINSNISVHSGNAQFDLFVGDVTGLLDYCEDDREMEFYFVNTGSQNGDFARDLKVDLLAYEEQEIYILPASFELYDYKANGYAISNSLISAHSTINWYFPRNSTITPGYKLDFSANTAPGLLEDLDGDGFYDDLAAGDTLRLTVKIRFTDYTELQGECPLDILQNYGMPQISWLTSCGELRTSIDGNTFYQNRYYVYNYPDDQSMVDLITEPVDFIEASPEIFRFCTGSWYYNWNLMDCEENAYQGVISLPAGFHLNNTEAMWYSAAGDSMVVSAQEIGNTVVVDGIGKSLLQPENWTGCFNVELVLICPEDGLQSPAQISWEMQYKCSDCDVIQRRACATEEVYVHVSSCPGSKDNCQGIYSSSFEMKRTTLGWTDATRQQHVNMTQEGLRLNAAYAYDKVESYTSGLVIGENMEQVFVDVIYTAPNQLFSFESGRFEIYRDGQLAGSCAANAPALLVIDNNYTNRFQMPCHSLLLPGDSVVLVAAWMVENSLLITKTREYEIPELRSRYMSLRNDTLSACDSWGARFTLFSNKTFPVATVGTASGCSNLTVNLAWINLGGSKGNDFPHEFRNLGKLDNEVIFSIPAGYSYVDGSARMFAYTPNETGISPRFFTDNTTLITPAVSSDGLSLIFNENWPLVDKAGNYNVSYTTPPLLSFEIRPDCDHEDTVFALMDFSYKNYQYLEDPAMHQQIGWEDTWHDDGNNPAANMRWYHYLPNLQVTQPGLTTVDAYTNTVSWDLKVCNRPDAQHNVIASAGSVWLDIDEPVTNSGNILINSVFDLENNTNFNVSDYNNGAGAFVEIGEISANACRTYRINASYTNCAEDELDSLRILTGWACGAYPEAETAETASCQVDTSFFIIRYKTSNLQMSVAEPLGIYEMCDTLNYQVTLTSSEPANLYDIKLWGNLPDGAHIINAFYQYPEDNTSWINLDLSASADFSGYNPHGWDLSGIVPEFLNGFPGSRTPGQNEIRVRFEVVMDCMYHPGQEFVIFARGTTNCNDSLALNAHYTLPLNLSETPVIYRLSHNIKDTMNCENPNTITYTVKNTENRPNTAGDSLRIEIPAGFYFVTGSGLPSQPFVSGNTLYWALGSMGAYNSKTFSFRIEADNFTGCNELLIPVEIIRTASGSTCGMSCNPTGDSGKDTLHLVYCCGNNVNNGGCEIDASFRNVISCAGSPMCPVVANPELSIEYANTWDFGDGSSSTDAEPCHVYTNPGTYTVTHIVRNLYGCIDTVTRTVKIVPAPTIRLSGNSYICDGSSRLLRAETSSSCQWSLNGNILATASEVNVSAAGTYVMVTTAPNGCTVTDSVVVASRVVDPVVTSSAVSMCVGYNVVLSASCDPSFYYQWQKFVAGNWVNLTGTDCSITTPVYKAGQNMYRVIVRDQLSGCESIKTVSVQGTTQNCKQVTVSPNPTEKLQSAIHYSFDPAEYNAAYLEIYDMKGEIISTQTVDLNQEKAELDFNGRAEGIYLVRLFVDGQEVATEKIMVLNR